VKINELITFRKDLLFNGAVQTSWLESDIELAHKAAEHFVFHGPAYHGFVERRMGDGAHKLIDTATFTLDVLESITRNDKTEPFALAIAGYGTGKSHLGVTLASLLSDPQSTVAEKILSNLKMADEGVAKQVGRLLNKPHIVITINGMNDFDLSGELIRQLLVVLINSGLDTSVIENLKPRFKTAVKFTKSFYNHLESEFKKSFGQDCTAENIIQELNLLDEDAYRKVSEIYEQKMDGPLAIAVQESLDNFFKIVTQNYCGNGKPFAGMLIIFDEFGRYMEFSVQKPHIAGSGALQNLYEGVQANSDKVFLLNFIQYDLTAYLQRIAPELRDALNRFVTRYVMGRKLMLSTNLETLIANLIEKKDLGEIKKRIEQMQFSPAEIHDAMLKWFPDEIKQHSIWKDRDQFAKVICQGCWPLHPLSTWVFYKLVSGGKTLQQRSALSLLDESISEYGNKIVNNGQLITPAEICSSSLINEFLLAEESGHQGASAHAYESVISKNARELSEEEITVLKTILIFIKIGIKIDSKDDFLHALTMVTELDQTQVSKGIKRLEFEFAVLEWNDTNKQFDITGDAVPRRAFDTALAAKAKSIKLQERADLFSQKFKRWCEEEEFPTDFGTNNDISTKDWHYSVHYTNVNYLEGQVDYALRNWKDAIKVDEPKGHLIYCYVGPESNVQAILDKSNEIMRSCFDKIGLDWSIGAPLAIAFIHDEDGKLGNKIADYWVLTDEMLKDHELLSKFKNFILDKTSSVLEDLKAEFEQLKLKRLIHFAADVSIEKTRTTGMLTNLFDLIYKERCPFPFDGFHTAKGNAAKYCMLYTKELFRGVLDKDWISARTGEEKERAYTVLDSSWGIFAENGTLKVKPRNSAVSKMIELIDNQLQDEITENIDQEKSTSLCLGSAIRQLCSPPFGCNIASAGLVIAYFAGKRKNELNFYRNDEIISVDNWLSEAFSSYFLDITYLDQTAIQKVSGKALTEWEVLLDEWESEKSFDGQVKCLQKSRELNSRIAVPQQFYHQYALFKQNAEDAQQRILTAKRKIDSALEKIEGGHEDNKLDVLSWGAAELTEVYKQFKADPDIWGTKYTKALAKKISESRIIIQRDFPEWIEKQKILHMNEMERFKHNLIVKVGRNLKTLGLDDEYELLKKHVSSVEEKITLITAMRNLTTEIQSMLNINSVTNSTPVSTLTAWIEQADKFLERLKEAKHWTHLVQTDVEGNENKLLKFKGNCKAQIDQYRDRTATIFNIENIETISDIGLWRKEIGTLLVVYENCDSNLEDLLSVQKHLDLIEGHYLALSDQSLNDDELIATYRKLTSESASVFDGEPPLDNELIYENMIKNIKTKREITAREWINTKVPDIKDIERMDAVSITQVKNRLIEVPRLLSEEQLLTVRAILLKCEKRLDELDVDGLVAKFHALSDRAKKSFIDSIQSIINELSKIN
jgi:hypothetical protein